MLGLFFNNSKLTLGAFYFVIQRMACCFLSDVDVRDDMTPTLNGILSPKEAAVHYITEYIISAAASLKVSRSRCQSHV